MSPIKYGFTGTRSGLNDTQKHKLIELFENDLKSNSVELHHGDCVGADKDVHEICEKYSINIIIHPPTDNKLRSFCYSDNIYKELPYLQRNKKIVDETDILIACPFSEQEQLRSGVWSTIRYAKKKNKTVIIFN